MVTYAELRAQGEVCARRLAGSGIGAGDRVVGCTIYCTQPPEGVGELVEEAERCGFDAVFTAEAWGSDAFTPLAWWGRQTSRLRLGTSIVQMSGRTPTSIAMHALTLDHLSGGRMVLGMGVSGPQVVEGWYGQPSNKPLRGLFVSFVFFVVK